MLPLKDTLKHKGMRNQLAENLAKKGITDTLVLEAIKAVPRHLFIDSSFETHAYEDKAFPIGAEQTISHPSTVAFQTQLLQVKSGQKVLEIGTGSGYQSSVLLFLGVKLFTIERQFELFKQAKLLIPKLINRPLKMYFGDGYAGLPQEAPFDRILVTAGAPQVPQALLAQLAVGGRMVIPIGKNTQTMTLFERISEKEFHKSEYGEFQFVPLLKNRN
ncbi:protein-L-isoaspartate(D-aspartate) O-methyltransferase [Capnocytophaga canimorsus]|nr:protein-L-isoaspartate(D-aspartate) O-methyltransferase [Capnocytophaga canimorsus]ATA76333.1 protein-L-isoaspartate O-methyltransferase [Capnocytophaga canimorsus]ATA90897.1 protein-L-isoaspartate O-methyltransferase [Capnocytophaga canimorsus]ATA93100.1 protein-L-isoaspartate O-methyltransferase [Capnocytophaga canimorsus]AWL77751.1 protein-L-isoaspartate(D-aspartate) O-methyltransferase [Capnocytophaga canimorsus]AYW36364.1 protein-L-isoaspartate(D-aspartate) O-methyltransferase [Capnocy